MMAAIGGYGTTGRVRGSNGRNGRKTLKDFLEEGGINGKVFATQDNTFYMILGIDSNCQREVNIRVRVEEIQDHQKVLYTDRIWLLREHLKDNYVGNMLPGLQKPQNY